MSSPSLQVNEDEWLSSTPTDSLGSLAALMGVPRKRLYMRLWQRNRKIQERNVPRDAEGVPHDAEDVPRDAEGVPHDAEDVPRDAEDVPHSRRSTICHPVWALHLLLSSSCVQPRPSLELLTMVAQEEEEIRMMMRMSNDDAGMAHHHHHDHHMQEQMLRLEQRLRPLPLYVLAHLAEKLEHTRMMFAEHVLRPMVLRYRSCVTHNDACVRHGVVWCIALWQREFPLPILVTCLKLLRAPHAHPTRNMIVADDDDGSVERTYSSSPYSPQRLEELHRLMCSLTDCLFTAWRQLPWRARCDVLMTYPHLPVLEQMKMIQKVCHTTTTKVAPPPDCNNFAAELLVPTYVRADALPQHRWSARITAEGFNVLRQALERHKIDGPRRLSQGSYA